MKLSMVRGKLDKANAQLERSAGGARKKERDLTRYGDGASSSSASSPSPKRQRRAGSPPAVPEPPAMDGDGESKEEPEGDDLESVLGGTGGP